MKNNSLLSIAAGVFISTILFASCKKQYSNPVVEPSIPNQSFIEEFDTVTSALARGWQTINVSVPKGLNVWQQGGAFQPWFPAFSPSGSRAGFIGADYSSTSADQGIISNWLVSPTVIFQNGDKISFYTRAYIEDQVPFGGQPGDSTDYGNRLQLLANLQNTGLNVGSGTDAGDYSVWLDINPSYVMYHSLPSLYSAAAYPARWTRFETTISGLNKPQKGRFAFRYFVEGGGSNGLASGVGIDKVEYKSISK